jgi:hypothetical protein
LTPRSRCDDWDSDTVEWLLAQLRERDRQLAEARAALEHYADKANWGRRRDYDTEDWYIADPVDSNGYDVARDTLERMQTAERSRA